MAKTTKTQPQRKPVRARGAVPVPKVAPKRVRRVWYKQRPIQAIGILVIVAFLAILVKAGLSFKDARDQRKDNLKAVEQFERAVELLQGPNAEIFTAINKAPQEFQSGAMSAADFKAQTDTWLATMRKLDEGLRKQKIPSGLPSFEEARALLVQGTMVYIDAVKSFQLAAGLTDPAQRDAAIAQGNSLKHHGDAVYGMGQRRLQRLKTSLGGEGGEDLLGPVQLPNEEAPPPPPQDPTGGGGFPGQPGGIPGQPGGIPGQPGTSP